MTSAPQKTAPAPAAPAGAPSLDGVLEIGEELRKRIHAEISEERRRYVKLAGELRIEPLCRALVESAPPGRNARRWVEDMPAEPGSLALRVVRAYDALKVLMHACVRSVHDALSGARELSDGNGIAFEAGSRHRARAAVENAAMWFPDEWMRRSNAAGTMRATVGWRGVYESEVREGHPRGVPCVPLARAKIRVEHDAPFASAVHELAHRMQDVVPGLARLEGEFFRRRTKGSRARTLDWYRRDELFRVGDPAFFTAYAGKDPSAAPDEPCEAYEVFPTGLEALVGQELETFERFYLFGDREHEAFVLGCLARL